MKCRNCKHYHYPEDVFDGLIDTGIDFYGRKILTAKPVHKEDYCDCCNECYKAYCEKVKNMQSSNIDKLEKEGTLNPNCNHYAPTKDTLLIEEMHKTLEDLLKSV